MSSLPNRESLLPQVRAMQAIIVALTSGVVMFALLALVLDPREAIGGVIFSLISLALSAVCLMMAVVIPQTIKPSETLSGVGAFQTRMIISCGLLEGGAFLNLVAFWLERHGFTLAIAIFFLAAILIQFPTVPRVTRWLARHERPGQEQRDFER